MHTTRQLGALSKKEIWKYIAGIDSYGGGGYVYRIRGSSKKIRQDLKSLQQQRWINNHTRAVFLEFAVYNANVNLFGIATIVAEFIPGGGNLLYYFFAIIAIYCIFLAIKIQYVMHYCLFTFFTKGSYHIGE